MLLTTLILVFIDWLEDIIADYNLEILKSTSAAMLTAIVKSESRQSCRYRPTDCSFVWMV